MAVFRVCCKRTTIRLGGGTAIRKFGNSDSKRDKLTCGLTGYLVDYELVDTSQGSLAVEHAKGEIATNDVL